jgi:multicomponent Na+:H+ antiporter subunit E
MEQPMSIRRLISRAIIFAFTWWVLTKGAIDSWPIGIPAILAAIYLDYRFFRPRAVRWSVRGFIVFVFFFIKSSISSGIDVVRRAYHPRLPLNPAMIEYSLRLTSSAARSLFACTVSLLPGTLSVGIDERRLIVHVLDAGRPVKQELNIIEDRVAAVFQHRFPAHDPKKESD